MTTTYNGKSLSISTYQHDSGHPPLRSPPPPPPPPQMKWDSLPRASSVPLDAIRCSQTTNRGVPSVVEQIETKRREMLNEKIRTMRSSLVKQPRKAEKFRMPTLVISKGTPMLKALANAQRMVDLQRKGQSLSVQDSPLLESCPEDWGESLTASSLSSPTLSASEEGWSRRESNESLEDPSCEVRRKSEEDVLKEGCRGAEICQRSAIAVNVSSRPNDSGDRTFQKFSEESLTDRKFEAMKTTPVPACIQQNKIPAINECQPRVKTFKSSFSFVPQRTEASGHNLSMSGGGRGSSPTVSNKSHKLVKSDAGISSHQIPVTYSCRGFTDCNSDGRGSFDAFSSFDNINNKAVSSHNAPNRQVSPAHDDEINDQRNERRKIWVKSLSVPAGSRTTASLPLDYLGSSNHKIVHVTVGKGPFSLGLCIEGGKGSPLGDRPITIKRPFKGDNSDEGDLHPGDVILEVNGQRLEGMTHFQVWNLLKVCSDDTMIVKIIRKVDQ